MRTRVQRWGNSLGLRIPKAFAAEVEIDAGSTVDLSVEDGDLIVRPVTKSTYDIDELISRIVPSNVHEPVDWGEPVGREAW
jgi:antitoxin MazE